ncbi:hypothetical protein [Haloarcula onubensis]|uniref:Uncharacterized protein n=1 Tax=Haloarcula onubensis TaxID=2950539 RepID=A0ABU2FVD5_9EURY|nr:hypothetical protein [Halomicroarcula sp. S3CR25-11]MDS0284738.1 hypothetical protein [Halomicroarcula sp. S3CR25-11]
MRQSKRELHRQIEELDDGQHEGPDRIEINEVVVGTGHSGDDTHAGDVVDERTTVVEL